MNHKYKIYTLGCKLNFAESSSIGRGFEALGYERAARRDERAAVVTINSCAVTGESERKTRELIRRVVRENPGAEVVVTGCYAALRKEELLSIEGVTRVETTKSLAAYSSGDRTRSFLKVQDGCDYHCTYCTVWRARGASRNAPIAEVVESARAAAERGAKELVLTGVNVGDFGRSTGETLLQLVEALDAGVEGVGRWRISSIEPNLLTDELIAFCAAHPRWMPHFHIPLQSGSDAVLKKMGRRYTADFFAQKVAQVRAAMPRTFFGVDVIVGFPGETDEDFQATVGLLERVHPSFLHVFPYSARPGTAAAKMEGQVAVAVKKERVRRLNALSEQLLAEFTERELAQGGLSVLVEGRAKNGTMFGHTENYIRIELDHGTINERIGI